MRERTRTSPATPRGGDRVHARGARSPGLAPATACLVALLLFALALGRSAPAAADVDELRARLAALHEPRDGEADLVAAAERALAREATDRAAGDEAARARAEQIADAAIGLVETRRRRAEAELALRAAVARRAALEARERDAETTRASDETERARLAAPDATP